MRITGKRSTSALLSGFLGLAWYFLFVAIVAVLVGLVAIAASPQSQVDLRLYTQFLRLTFIGSRGAEARMIAVGGLGLVLLGLVIAQSIVYRLRKILASLNEGEPFAIGNSRHVRAIGMTVLAGSILNAIGSIAVGYLATSSIHLAGIDLSPRAGSPLSGIFLGLVILVLASVFRRGSELQEDHDMTV
jgi:hypothetical protein